MERGQLFFDFANEHGIKLPRLFQNPTKVITTSNLEEVLGCFKQVEQASGEGKYVAGYVSYEAAPAFDPAFVVNSNPSMPLVWFGVYDQCEHQRLSTDEDSFQFVLTGEDTSRKQYDEAITTIHQNIEEGNTYQTNYTIRMYGKLQGSAKMLFQQLQHAQQANYTAYLNIGSHEILSASPELFFHLKDRMMTTKPMKGTVRRGRFAKEDEVQAEELYHSIKNRAENVMIVDLLRNDLGRIAKTNTVQVEKLFEIEQYPTVHQMTSTIKAQLREEVTLTDIFQALFPCGSITGAPKVSTMEMIAQLERSPRDVYCGAIGFITPEGEATFNVPIRTAVVQGDQLTYGVGGGITWDSSANAEFDEVLAKAQVLTKEHKDFHLLESLLLENGQYFLVEEHLKRIEQSAKYFGWDMPNKKRIYEHLLAEAKGKVGKHKVRLLLSRDGEIHIESAHIADMSEVINVALAKGPVDSSNVFLFHKTTYRDVYKQHLIPQDCFDVLLFNEKDEITEFTFGNVIVEKDGQWFTPPVACGLLAGTYREWLLCENKVKEKIIYKKDLFHYDAIYFINSVRKIKKVNIV